MDILNFKQKTLTINENIYFDKNDYLREKATDPSRLNEFIDEARFLLKNSNKGDKYFLHGVLGNLYRINGQPKEAIKCLTYCLDYAIREKSCKKEIISLIRLGEAFKYDNNPELALDKFNKAWGMCKNKQVDEYLDFALQHKGKCLMELTRLEDAEICFIKALEIRNKKGDSSLVDSSQQAIDLVRELKMSQRKIGGCAHLELGLKRNEVRLVDYSEEWQSEFQRVKQAVLCSISIPENRIEHIGSTAIKGMAAKPILDLIVGVDNIEDVDESIFKGLKKIGFLRLRVHRPSEIVLAKFTDETYEEKTHFIHLVDYNKKLWKNLIFFRDYLNKNESARKQYSNLKMKFIKERNHGIKEYTDYKEQFVKDIFRKRIES